MYWTAKTISAAYLKYETAVLKPAHPAAEGIGVPNFGELVQSASRDAFFVGAYSAARIIKEADDPKVAIEKIMAERSRPGA